MNGWSPSRSLNRILRRLDQSEDQQITDGDQTAKLARLRVSLVQSLRLGGKKDNGGFSEALASVDNWSEHD